jgi:cell division septation protein DedD
MLFMQTHCIRALCVTFIHLCCLLHLDCKFGLQLSELKISDEYMLAASYSLLKPEADLSKYTLHTEKATEEIRQGLSDELSLQNITAAGITKTYDLTKYVIVIGSEDVSYNAEEYLTALNAFIQKYVTDYQTALDELNAAQTKYDAAISQNSLKEDTPSASPTASSSTSATPTPTATVSSTPAASPTASPSASATATPTASPSASPSPTPTATPIPAVEISVLMYRMYNPNSGEHFYTANVNERDHLISVGWIYEGVGWKAPQTSNSPVYRLYNANGGEHHYTLSLTERDMLTAAGWLYEGIGWYSDDNKTVPLYRQYNPNAYSCNHNYTISKDERNHLVGLGWIDEGISWYGVDSNVYMEGIDISEHNGDIDLTQYRCDFVIIRAGWGTGVVDKQFLNNIKKCEELKIPYGLYWYSYALNKEDAELEASTFIETIKDCKPTVGVWLDMEDADGYKRKYDVNFMKGTLISDICKAFCTKVKAAGYHTGIYASQSWFDYHITGCDEFDKWLAVWGINDGTFTDASDYGAPLHQFTSTPLDRDVMYADISVFSK